MPYVAGVRDWARKRIGCMLQTLLLWPLLAGAPVSAKSIPDLRLRDLNGVPQKLSSLRGHIAVVNFWATWCAPCREELPRLSRLSDAYAANGVVFLAVSLDEKKTGGEIGRAISQYQLHMPVWTGANADTLDQFKMGNVLPATLIVDENGIVLRRIQGEARDADIRSLLDWALGGRHGPAPELLVRRY